jgi:IS605 OrfB family transposase
VKTFTPTSATFDQRIFSFREQDWTVSLTLKHGRARLALALGNYQRGKLRGQCPTSATLVTGRRGTYALHIQVKRTPPPPCEPTDILGVDLGRRDIAHTSDGQDWSGQDLTATRDHYSRVRGGLQQKASKGTRSTRRRCRQLLHRLSGREKRFQRHTNHCIAKTLVETAQTTGRSLAMEDLTGIRARTNQAPRTKAERRQSNSWAFFQLRQFVTYKAQAAGVIVDLVPAAYTSKMCHVCLHIGSRSGKAFRCPNPACGWGGDADFNGAQNLKTLGRQVRKGAKRPLPTQSQKTPRGPWIQCPWPNPQGSQKAQAL